MRIIDSRPITLWSTIECTCWAMNYDYESYVTYAKSQGATDAQLFNEGEYIDICEVLEQYMVRNMGVAPIQHPYEDLEFT